MATTTKWVPVLELKIEGDDRPAANALYAKIVEALNDVGVIIDHKDESAWSEIQATGEQHRASDVLDEINPVVLISCVVQS